MIFAKLLFVFLFLVTIDPSFEARVMCPDKGMLCGQTCTIEAKPFKCECEGRCDGVAGPDGKPDYPMTWGDASTWV